MAVTLSKILNNIGNDTLFIQGARQDFTQFNDLIEASSQFKGIFVGNMLDYKEKISKSYFKGLISPQIRETAFRSIHYHLYYYLEPLTEAKARKKSTSSETRNFVRLMSIIEEMELTEGKPEYIIISGTEEKKKKTFRIRRRKRRTSDNTRRISDKHSSPLLFNKTKKNEISEDPYVVQLRNFNTKLKSSLEHRHNHMNRMNAITHKLVSNVFPNRDESLIRQTIKEQKMFSSMYIYEMLSRSDIFDEELSISYTLDHRTAMVLDAAFGEKPAYQRSDSLEKRERSRNKNTPDIRVSGGSKRSKKRNRSSSETPPTPKTRSRKTRRERTKMLEIN
eukprot:TRINITY_DN8575_c0_g1_i4.p1 TRINITY_DN8575_c0_g1~~TRINITY_DN8575_c0_g1_i4.p1  ORF type:complete len:335 (+),score=61.47 TRINITY_DN8575_c0_g1_i4:695-1699(+)